MVTAGNGFLTWWMLVGWLVCVGVGWYAVPFVVLWMSQYERDKPEWIGISDEVWKAYVKAIFPDILWRDDEPETKGTTTRSIPLIWWMMRKTFRRRVAPRRVLGGLEVTLAYGAFLSQRPEIVAGWLVFKTAAKWKVWEHIMHIPDDPCSNVTKLQFMTMRTRWANAIMDKWLVGTLLNVLIGFVGALFVLSRSGYR